MANGYKYVCAVSALFRAARAFVRGPAQRIFCMPGTRYRSPDSRPSAGVSRARGRAGCWRIRVGRRCSGLPGQPGQPGPEARPRPCGLLANQGGAAVSRSVGPAGVGGSPAAVRVVGESGRGGVPVCRKPGARVCLSGSRGGQSDADTGVGRPESGGADECRDAFGLPACLPGNAGACHPNRVVGLPERDACCGYGRSAVLAARKK